jgi:hypothetical protein
MAPLTDGWSLAIVCAIKYDFADSGVVLGKENTLCPCWFSECTITWPTEACKEPLHCWNSWVERRNGIHSLETVVLAGVVQLAFIGIDEFLAENTLQASVYFRQCTNATKTKLVSLRSRCPEAMIQWIHCLSNVHWCSGLCGSLTLQCGFSTHDLTDMMSTPRPEHEGCAPFIHGHLCWMYQHLLKEILVIAKAGMLSICHSSIIIDFCVPDKVDEGGV